MRSGRPATARTLPLRPSAIAAKGNVDDLQEALAEGITVGHPDMPEFELLPEQVASFLAYLKSLAPSGR